MMVDGYCWRPMLVSGSAIVGLELLASNSANINKGLMGKREDFKEDTYAMQLLCHLRHGDFWTVWPIQPYAEGNGILAKVPLDT